MKKVYLGTSCLIDYGFFFSCAAVQLVAVPISTTSPAKMSPLKEHTILPKQVLYLLDGKNTQIIQFDRYPH